MLNTIQKREKLNIVKRVGEEGPGGAYHTYEITCDPYTPNRVIEFQKGPRKEKDSQHGVLDCDLLEIVRDRLTSFQEGPYACRENDAALILIEQALMWMNKRVEDRIERQVLGTYEK